MDEKKQSSDAKIKMNLMWELSDKDFKCHHKNASTSDYKVSKQMKKKAENVSKEKV